MNLSAGVRLSDRVEVLPRVFLRTDLPKEARAEIQKLFGPRPAPFITQLAFAWFLIVGSIYMAIKIDAWWATALTIIVVASRQNVFGLLVHEQAHRLAFRSRFGDIFTNLFAAYPLIAFSVENYAKTHLTHHKYYFTDRDPDHHRKSGVEWSVPMTKYELATWFLKDLSGLSTIKLIRGKSANVGSTEFERSQPTPKFIRPVFLLAHVIGLTVFKLWPIYLLYWVLPLFTVLPVFVRWGALTEHIYNTAGYEVEENSPLIIPSLFDRMFLPYLNFSYHAYHHWHQAISFSKLPKVHEIYCKYGMVDESKVFCGNISFLKFITRKV